MAKAAEHTRFTRADAEVTLRAAGLRVTAPRLAVLVWLDAHPHSTVAEVAAGVREQLGTVSTQAVYNVLEVCAGAELLRRSDFDPHAARFERRVGDNHHHLVCRGCGRTEDVECVVGTPACLTPDDDHGFAVDEADVVFRGLCPRCAAGA